MHHQPRLIRNPVDSTHKDAVCLRRPCCCGSMPSAWHTWVRVFFCSYCCLGGVCVHLIPSARQTGDLTQKTLRAARHQNNNMMCPLHATPGRNLEASFAFLPAFAHDRHAHTTCGCDFDTKVLERAACAALSRNKRTVHCCTLDD